MQVEVPDRADVIALLSQLVAIDSVNPSLVPGAAGESTIAHWIAAWCRQEGLETMVQEVAPGRPNVIARLPGTGGGRTLLLNAHMDTVGLSDMIDPLTPRVDGDRLYGRGAFDMKGGLAAIMLAARLVRTAGVPRGDLILAAVADEEYASLGTQRLLEVVRADGAVVTEPTALDLCVAHKGFAWLTIRTEGRAAHGSARRVGVDAIARMGRVLTRLEVLEERLAAQDDHRLLQSGSIHASLIKGGQELSTYPAHCVLQVERRTIPGETPESVTGEIAALLEAIRAEDPSFRAELELTFWRDPFQVELDEPVVQAMRSAAHAVLHQEPREYGDTPWMDAALISAAGIPTVVFGPGGEGAHARVEYAHISSVAKCARALAIAARDFCR